MTAIMIPALSCGPSNDSQSAELIHIPRDLKNDRVAVSGIYQDGWAGETVSATLQQPAGKRVLAVRGMVPIIEDSNFHTDVEVTVDKQSVSRTSIGLGEFQILTPVKEGIGKREVKLTFSSVQQLPSGDGRSVSAKLQSIGFEAPSTRDPVQSSDIVQGTGLQLGTAWGQRESFHNETFRWVENDAQILLTPATSGEKQVRIRIEPGPGIDGPFLLKALDASGRRIDAVRVKQRETVELFLPGEAGKTAEFRLHVDSGGKRTASDPRVLNFRVFQISVGPLLNEQH